MLHSHRLFISPPLTHTELSPSSPLLLRRFTISSRLYSSSQLTIAAIESEIGPVSKPITKPEGPEPDSGPIELPPSSFPDTIFSVDDNPSPLQVATSVLLTGAITVFLFRSLRRRARRAKELRVRSSGVKSTKDIKEEALESLKMIGVAPIEALSGPPSPIQALLGSIGAAVITYILYRFTTTIESSLNRQAISDTLSVRQITITVRTIINGICYLATFVFGINSVGLLLYSIQLAISSLMDSLDPNVESEDESVFPVNVENDVSKSSIDSVDSLISNVEDRTNDS